MKKKFKNRTKQNNLLKKRNKNFNTALGELYFNGSTAATDAEELGDAYLKVWTDAIFEDKGAEIDGKTTMILMMPLKLNEINLLLMGK